MRQDLYTKLRDTLLAHCQTRFHVLHPPAAVVSTTLGLIDTCRTRSPFDLLHVATAEYIRALVPGGSISFMCRDAGLRSIAEERGFPVFDPVHDPLSAL